MEVQQTITNNHVCAYIVFMSLLKSMHYSDEICNSVDCPLVAVMYTFMTTLDFQGMKTFLEHRGALDQKRNWHR